MLRRTWIRLLSLAEAQRLVLDANGQQLPTPTADLPKVLTALTEHYRTGGEAFTRAALLHVTQLDMQDADSQCVATASLGNTSTIGAPASVSVNTGSTGKSQTDSTPRHLITELLRVYPHSPEIRERCCRCLANMCRLSPTVQREGTDANAVLPVSSSSPSSSSSEGSPSIADTLVDEGAVELILGTLAMANRLSPRGRCWAALAMLNIICMSHSGAARATKAGAEGTLAEFILFLLEDATANAPGQGGEDQIHGFADLTSTALDAALGALVCVLSAEAPENAKGVSFNYEAVSYATVDAVVRALLFVSALLVRDGRNDGAYGASVPARRYGTVLFQHASPTQQVAVVALLPLLHKAWMALREVCSCTTNLPMVFDVVYEAANANQESMVVANEAVVGGAEEVLQVTAQTERQYVAALSTLLDAALFLTTEVEGLADVGAEELARLQKDVRLYVMDAMQAMTSSRKDTPQKAPAETEAEAGASTDVDVAAAAGDEDAVDVYPTTAAMSVTDVLASGTVSNMALAAAVSLLAEHDETIRKHKAVVRAAGSQVHAVLAPYKTDDFTLLSKSLVVLANNAEKGDDVATSGNTVAGLQAVLVNAVEAVQELPSAYKSGLAELFKPTAEEDDGTPNTSSSAVGASAATADRTTLHADDRLAFLQQAALVGQVYAVLWSVLRTASGVTTVSQLCVLQTAQDVQAALRSSYMPALEEAKRRYGKAARAAASSETPHEEAQPSQATESGWVPNAAEETVARLSKLSDELIDNLSKLSAAGHAPGSAGV